MKKKPAMKSMTLTTHRMIIMMVFCIWSLLTGLTVTDDLASEIGLLLVLGGVVGPLHLDE